MRYLILALALSSCATPTVTDVIVNGLEIREHIDSQNNPCYPAQGCYVFNDGKHHVFYSSNSPEWLITHERCHALGMRHEPWIRLGNSQYAKITASGCHYRVMQTIVIRDGIQREFIIK